MWTRYLDHAKLAPARREQFLEEVAWLARALPRLHRGPEPVP